MSWIERSVEERLAQASRSGELDTPHLAGRPLPDLDRQRPQGWWADQFARRELSHDRRVAADEALAERRAAFWRCAEVDELHDLVADANRYVARINVNLVPADVIEPFDPADIEARWRRVRDAR